MCRMVIAGRWGAAGVCTADDGSGGGAKVVLKVAAWGQGGIMPCQWWRGRSGGEGRPRGGFRRWAGRVQCHRYTLHGTRRVAWHKLGAGVLQGRVSRAGNAVGRVVAGWCSRWRPRGGGRGRRPAGEVYHRKAARCVGLTLEGWHVLQGVKGLWAASHTYVLLCTDDNVCALCIHVRSFAHVPLAGVGGLALALALAPRRKLRGPLAHVQGPRRPVCTCKPGYALAENQRGFCVFNRRSCTNAWRAAFFGRVAG